MAVDREDSNSLKSLDGDMVNNEMNELVSKQKQEHWGIIKSKWTSRTLKTRTENLDIWRFGHLLSGHLLSGHCVSGHRVSGHLILETLQLGDLHLQTWPKQI